MCVLYSCVCVRARVLVCACVRVRACRWPGRANGLFSSGATALSEALVNLPALTCIKSELELPASYRRKPAFAELSIELLCVEPLLAVPTRTLEINS